MPFALETFVNGRTLSDPSVANTTLNGGIDASTTTVTFASTAFLPATAQFRILIDDELMLVTDLTGLVGTVTRHIEGTTAASHEDEADVFQVVTMGGLARHPLAMTTLGDMVRMGADGAPIRIAAPSNGTYLAGWADGVLSWSAYSAPDLSGYATSAGVASALTGYVPTSRTVNGQALSSNVSLAKSDIGLGNVEDAAASALYQPIGSYLTSVTAHNLLSATHGDTTAASAARGALIYGNGSGAWASLVKPSVLSGLSHDGTDVSWVTAEGTGAPVRKVSPTITTPTIAKLANLTTNGFVKTSAGDGTLSVDTRPLTPADVPSLVAWYGRSGYSAGVWTDGSGLGNHTSQATANKRPASDVVTYARAIPACDGVNDELVIPNGVSVNQNNFAVFVRFWSDGPRITQQAAAVFVLGAVGCWVQPTWDVYKNGFAVSGTPYPRYGDNVLALRSNGSRVKLTLNGVEFTGAALSSATLTGGKIGWYAADLLAANHRYAEMIIYGVDPSDADAQRVLDWLYTGAAPSAPAAYAYSLLMFDGNSMTYGAGSSGVAGTYPSQCVAALTQRFVAGNVGVSGQKTTDMTADSVAQLDPLYSSAFRQDRNIVIAWEGTNDLYSGASAATAFANLKTYCQARKDAGWRVLLLTILPRSEIGTPGAFETSRGTVNTSLRADFPTSTAVTRVFAPNTGITYANYLVDVAANTTIGDAGDETNATYYADLVHMTDAGYALIATDVRGALGLLGIA